MLTYDYFCEENQQTVPVSHGIRERLATWGELCAKAGIDLGATPAETPVERLISGGLLVSTGSKGGSPLPLPMAGGCCGRPSSCSHHG